MFRRHSLKLLSPTLPILMNWILLSPPPLSSDPDNPPKFGMCTHIRSLKLEDNTTFLFGGDFNMYFDTKLDADGGNPK